MRDRCTRRRRHRQFVARAQLELSLALGAFDRLVAKRHRVLHLRVCSPVVRPLAVQRLDLQLLRARLDRQRALAAADRVVALRYFTPGDLVAVLAVAD